MIADRVRKFSDRVLLTWRLFKDPRVPIWQKAIPVLIFAYVVSPLDLIPDLLLGLGQLDDLTLILGGLRLFESVAPKEVVAEHRRMVESRHTPPEIVDAPSYRAAEKQKAK